ncbi:MAG: ABC transporter substrate-binding protein [Chloroflexota bacterium]
MSKRRAALYPLYLSIILVLLIGSLSGCADQQAVPATSTPVTDSTPTRAPVTDSIPTPANDEVATRDVVDMAGRKVTVPREIKKVFTTHAVGYIFLYTLDPSRIIGSNTNLTQTEKKYLLPELRDLPNLGGWGATVNANTEEILRIHPDLIISMEGMDATRVSLADKIQEQLGIPVLMLDNSLDKLPETYELMGDLLGIKARAQELASYTAQTVKEAKEKANQIPEQKRVRVYYAEGSKGLETDPKGSQHVEVLDLVGGINVAEVGQGEKGVMGRTPVSLEQVLAWNPEVIISWNAQQGGYFPDMVSDPGWQAIKAVSTGRVYGIPNVPFSWFDRPPSSNRLLGIKWLGNLLYPEVFTNNVSADVKEFFKEFYHYDLSDNEVDALLQTQP